MQSQAGWRHSNLHYTLHCADKTADLTLSSAEIVAAQPRPSRGQMKRLHNPCHLVEQCNSYIRKSIRTVEQDMRTLPFSIMHKH